MSVIETDDLTKYYGDVRGVEDLSFSVERGEVFGFLGPNGAGKTTTIRTLMGFQAPTAGSATVLDAEITDPEALREARANVGYLPDTMGFDGRVTGRRLLEYHGSLRGDLRSEELLELFDPPLDRKVRDYSRGNKQMLAIVLAFMHDPDLIIMDEPTSGLDPLKQEQFLEFIRAEQQRGKTFFFSSHILSEVRKVCDRVGIIRDGQLVELSDIEELLDRSGKHVRAHVDGSIDASDLDLAGIHDLEISGGGVEAAQQATTGDDREAPDGETAASTMSFTYTGGYDPLLRELLTYDLVDLTIEEAPLEDVFMRFYGADPSSKVEAVENSEQPHDAEDPQDPGEGTADA